MTVVEQKLTSILPNVAEEVKDYVLSVLQQNRDDFTSPDDVYDAIGEILLSSSENVDENVIMNLCTEIAHLLDCRPRSRKNSSKSKNDERRVLDGPIHIGNSSTSDEKNLDENSSIWIAKRTVASTVDNKKLEKADAKLKSKQEKRAQQSLTPVASSSSLQTLATANQMLNKKELRLENKGVYNTTDIKLENFDVCFGEKKLLTEANLTLVYGRRYGLVGRNGLGKTTLLKMISSGNLRIPSKITVLHVEQEVNGDETLVLESVLESDEERRNLLLEEKRVQAQMNEISSENQQELSEKLKEIYEQLELIEADKAPARAAAILYGLGFNSEAQKRPTKEFSGGWRMRLALARALFLRPDLLLLDEPTNMLDIKAIYWLENYLQNWRSTILVVSHDRIFLNEVATDVIHLHSQRLDYYAGNYDTFEKTKTEKLKNQRKEYEAQQQLREHVQVFIDRFRYNANRAALVQSKIKFLERLPDLKPVEAEHDVIFKFQECERVNPPVLQMDEIGFRYVQNESIFDKCTLNADMDSRICIVGENGAGKTTLLKLLLGDLEPTKGFRKAHRGLKMSYFTQHHVDQLVMEVSPLQFMQSKFPGQPVEQYRAALGRFGITGDLALQSIASLSGGQKSRLAFSVICMQNSNFLILDEPTNHLDVETVEALGKALNEFNGGVVLVSHDERLIDLICKELWVVKDRSVRRLEGGLNEYKQIIEQELAAQK